MRKHRIKEVLEGSIGEEMEIEPGDWLVAINGMEVEDALDYHLLVADSELELSIEKKDTGEEWEIVIEKEEDEDLGLLFESNLMDEYKSCTNRCVFCFIDQLPPGMRETMYFKDDDARLSFLQGNYITLTNMREKDVDRIIRYRLEPINISIHTMNMGLRQEMLGNKKADRILGYMEKLRDADIRMNGQIVLCKGINDGRELEYSIREMARFLPQLQSVSIVPVGLTRHRQGLAPLEPFTPEDAREVVRMVETWQKRTFASHNNHFIHAGDEFYFLAGENVPEAVTYDGYLQLENGVGMTRLLLDTFEEALGHMDVDPRGTYAPVALATGMLTLDLMRRLVEQVREKRPGMQVEVLGIRNDFFGERITVSGLLTGQDIIRQLQGKVAGKLLLLPSNLLRDSDPVLLDDRTLEDIGKALQVEVRVVQPGGKELIDALEGARHE
ncbi:DUF512 domain-containing protein [Anaerotalea alkaliphila]|uniref:DUF512 domain-containing protein n=1 Tax=Anaerotalea alkaliphila TaxID=2662126 RepID=A0A7X5HTD0_9FIRM|nr:DUF512 domain-containing protein [Anaerotalea alkaliphila]NDL66312.1 DUF512 domain-containing protein [Anaerotalea alkaliphila]